MKATDLMIGDYVRYIGTEAFCDMRQGDIVKVDALQGNYICVGNGWADGDMFEPIPLTEEIIEKFTSWILDKNLFSYKKDGENAFSVSMCMNTCIIETIFGYVHTFQHALRLCGIEKEIVL